MIFQMIKVDKSTEPDATAALSKLKQKEQVGLKSLLSYCLIFLRRHIIPIRLQEVEKKARKQFKGLFDKKPGEIAEVNANEGDQITSESQKDAEVQGDSSDGTNSEDSHEAAPDAHQSLFSRFWPSGRKLFSSLGLQRCTILQFYLKHNVIGHNTIFKWRHHRSLYYTGFWRVQACQQELIYCNLRHL